VKRFLVIKTHGAHKGTKWEFDTKREVVVFMWGLQVGNYAIFEKAKFSGDVDAISRLLWGRV
jgi:hypothetical protein